MNRELVRAVVWDYDGTLVDSLPRHYAALKVIFGRAGAKIPPLKTMCQWWYMPAGERFQALGVHTPEREIWPLYDRLLGDRMYQIFLGVREALSGLRRRNIPSFVITAAPYPDHVQDCLAKHSLLSLISDLYCDRENKVKDLADVADRLEIEKRHVMFVGDMISDIADGRTAGVRTIGFDGGYGGRQVLLGAGAEDIIDTPTEIFRLIDLLD
ncbi:MAG: HAD family hydrolase [Candidatus Vogelbacteria bacterium]|nr:HAD family hydrolase [Candidatus Vogelbacteria bacterium]